MKGNKYFNETQSTKWRDKQEDIKMSDRARRRDIERRVSTFGQQVKMLVEPAWWDSFDEGVQVDIYNDFIDTKMSYYYNNQTLNLNVWIKRVYKYRKPNTMKYRDIKLDDILK